MNNAIEVQHIKKQYGKKEVLKDISFTIHKGETFGILGVNGAGKTTTLECIEGFRNCDSGTINVNGSIGIQLQDASLQAHMKAMEAIHLFAKWNKQHLDSATLDALGINEFANTLYGSLSTGQKRRLHLALALLKKPDILFLDEPTAGLDVEGRMALHALIHLLQTQGKTIVLASHDMSEVEQLCDRIAILNHGEIAFLGTTDDLANNVGKHYLIKISSAHGEASYESNHIATSLLNLLKDYKQKDIDIYDIKIDRGTLEQHFIDIAKGRS